ncbi:hypothetical protein CYLTODRAFT_491890 [Cylindrobasidium torrendii FP15055 ss-10]|uniref:Uncharacterized protein n=1 Tax=Cylindrobasidium torrendii FP15055 ss-10 TaxID=1314674 RepID=A0A0D7B5W0_9AGAR|nr:hypothetical protein CYLTODRAFT_491890 [Cylindrobasidium torrendii FP15055 ss-10]
MAGGVWSPCASSLCPCPNHTIPTTNPSPADTFAEDIAFKHLTQGNEAATRAEEIFLDSEIHGLHARKESLNILAKGLETMRDMYQTCLVAIERQMDIISTERARLDASVSVRRRVMSSVRKLPLEVLQHIFLCAIDWPRLPTFQDVEDPVSEDWWTFAEEEASLWTVELVCQRWRSAVLNNPRLWSFVSICASANYLDDAKHPHYIPRLARQLYRARESLLSVHIFPESRHVPSLPRELVTILLMCAPRIRDLRLSIPHSHFGPLQPIQNHLQALDTLVLHNTPFHDDLLDTGDCISVFKDCSNLRNVHINEMCFPGWRLVIPWKSIHTLSLSHAYLSGAAFVPAPSSKHVVEILRLTETLRHLSLNLELHEEFETSMVTCQYLESIEFVTYPPSGTCHPTKAVLDLLILPSLTSITCGTDPDTLIDAAGWLEESVFAAIADVVTRSQCPLKKLTFTTGYCDTVDLERLLKASPKLELLSLSELANPGLASFVVRTLNSTPLISPVLEKLVLTGWLHEPDGTDDPSIWGDMVRARRGVLKQLVLKWEPASGPENLAMTTITEARVCELLCQIEKHVRDAAGVGFMFSGSVKAEGE